MLSLSLNHVHFPSYPSHFYISMAKNPIHPSSSSCFRNCNVPFLCYSLTCSHIPPARAARVIQLKPPFWPVSPPCLHWFLTSFHIKFKFHVFTFVFYTMLSACLICRRHLLLGLCAGICHLLCCVILQEFTFSQKTSSCPTLF